METSTIFIPCFAGIKDKRPAAGIYVGWRGESIRGHAEIRRKFIHLGCRLLFCKAFLQKWPHQSRGLVKVLDAVERDAIKPAEKRFG